jgi:DNA-binding NarL/FixJ family response regulator
MDEVIRVLLADDHPAFRLGLRVLMERAVGLEMVAEARDGQEALEMIERLLPDVAVLDCQLPGLDGTQVAQEIQRQGLPVRVLALSAYADDRYVREMLKAGAAGYLLKEEAPDVILAAVQTAARGERYFSSALVDKVVAWIQGERPGGLTEREMETLRLVAQGLSNREIAHDLGVKDRTVEFHMTNVLRKLGVASRVEAAMWAKEQGLVP